MSGAARRRAGSPWRLRLLALPALAAVYGCSTGPAITNHEPVDPGESYQSQYRSETSSGEAPQLDSKSLNAMRCAPEPEGSAARSAYRFAVTDPELLSIGDLVQVIVGGDESLSHPYKVGQDGKLALPHVTPINALGRTADQVQRDLEAQLIASGLYATTPIVSVRPMDAAAARVFVSGAVFEPGAVVVGGASGKDIDAEREKAMGYVAEGRRVSRAIQSAGGVRPDADLARVVLHRGKTTRTLDIRNALLGQPYADPVLLAGDHVEIRSRGCFQEKLVVPSAITLAGVKVFMSNLIEPVNGNAVGAVGKETQELRYGTRFIQAAVAMNCVGGTRAVNADRSVVLFTHNPVSGESIVVSRRILDLESRADRDDYNPFIMPGDALACYDSTQINVVQIATMFTAVLAPRALLK